MIGGLLSAWREVRAIVLGLFGALLAGVALRQRWLALLAGILLGWVAYFFRDPERIVASADPRAILSAADGRVTGVEILESAPNWPGPARRISVFLSLFDVHIQRSPAAGIVQLRQYQPGGFTPAYRPDADDNEANLLVIYTPYGPLGVRQVAGVLARRIVCWTQPGDALVAGQRFGLIKFGSRVDLLLPLETEILVEVGQKVVAGQTVVARWKMGD